MPFGGRLTVDERVQAVLAKLANDPKAAASLDRLASSVNLSASRLRHLFRQELGTPLSVFVRKSRMEHARILLDTTFLNVKQVVYELGLADETHFIRDFKRAWGTTSSAWRRQRSAGGVQPFKPTNSHPGR
jgi:AraC family transcriptional regulator, arabinose operon regulatory protein